MGLEAYQIAIIVVVAVFLVLAVFAFVKKRRQAQMDKSEVRSVSTIQSAYYTPAQYTQYPTATDSYAGSSAPGWNLTNLDRPNMSGINIRQPTEGAIIVPREPVTFAQPLGHLPYPTHNTSDVQQAYGKPPPYNPNFQ